MAVRADSYSRFVAACKVVLPLAAVGLLSTLFFFSGEIDPTQSIPYAELNVEEIAREQRISNPYFNSLTESGDAIAIVAAAARADPDNDSRLLIDNLEARLDAKDGPSTTMRAQFGDIDTGAERATLTGGTTISTSDGYLFETDGVTARLDETYVETLGPLRGTGPLGVMNAGQMVISRADTDAGQTIVFKGGVSLLYEGD